MIAVTTALNFGAAVVVVVGRWGGAVRVGEVDGVVVVDDGNSTVELGAMAVSPVVVVVGFDHDAVPGSVRPHELAVIATMTTMRSDLGTSPWCLVDTTPRRRTELLLLSQESLKLTLVCSR
ncbi:MAG: hypothetical protein P8N50_04820 [Actinomycetota bacterium]|nr:hypothetical protein [Actinomycetota bacterium]